MEAGADIEAKDHRGRTPLHLAAERDRTAAAMVLLSLDNPAVSSTCDDSGHLAMISLIQNMPEVTHLALNQLHELVTIKRSQHYYLSALEPAKTSGWGYLQHLHCYHSCFYSTESDKISCNTPVSGWGYYLCF